MTDPGQPSYPPPGADAGYSTAPPAYADGYQQPRPKPLSITGMVLGIVGVVLSFLYGIGVLPALVGLIISIVARRKEPHGKPFWLTGLITSIVGIVIALAVIAVVVVFVSYVLGHPGLSRSFPVPSS